MCYHMLINSIDSSWQNKVMQLHQTLLYKNEYRYSAFFRHWDENVLLYWSYHWTYCMFCCWRSWVLSFQVMKNTYWGLSGKNCFVLILIWHTIKKGGLTYSFSHWKYSGTDFALTLRIFSWMWTLAFQRIIRCGTSLQNGRVIL